MMLDTLDPDVLPVETKLAIDEAINQAEAEDDELYDGEDSNWDDEDDIDDDADELVFVDDDLDDDED